MTDKGQTEVEDFTDYACEGCYENDKYPGVVIHMMVNVDDEDDVFVAIEGAEPVLYEQIKSTFPPETLNSVFRFEELDGIDGRESS